MRIKTLVLSVVVAGGLLAGVPRSGGLAHAAPSAARSDAPSAARPAYSPCQTTVLQQVPLYNHVTIHGYAYLMRNLCDGNVFTRATTDLWWSTVNAVLTGPGGMVNNCVFLAFGGQVDSPEVPYTSGKTYYIDGVVLDLFGTFYEGKGTYTAP